MQPDEQPRYAGKLAIQQRVLPAYRAPFFEALAKACTGGLSLFAGQPQADEQIAAAERFQTAQYARARNWQILRVGSAFYQCWQSGLIEWLENWQPQALIVEANPRYRSTPAGVRWMHARGRPVLGWGLGAPPLNGALAGWRKQARLKLLNMLDGVIAYSQRGAEEYRRLGMPEQRVFVSPNAVAPRPLKPPAEWAANFDSARRVLFVGRLQQRKRIDLLLRACAALPAALQPRLCIVGEGPSRAELQALAADIYPQAEFPGARYGAELEQFFIEADIFVLPGTGGLAVQQAMSYGLPVIAAKGDGTQDDLTRPENGWRLPADDLGALTEALQTALADPARLRRMGAESYRIVAEEINLERMVEVFVGALNSLQKRA